MNTRDLLSILAGVAIASQIIGCASPKLASTPLDAEEELWQASVKSSYPSWTHPQTEPPVDINMTPGAEPEAIMVGEKIVELETPTIKDTVIEQEVDIIAPAVPAAPAGNDQTYVTQRGDSLWKIADKFYGDGKKWQAIADANKSVLPNPNKVKPGLTLSIPPGK